MADKLYALSNIVHGKPKAAVEGEATVEEIAFGEEVPADLDDDTLEELKEQGAIGTKEQLDAMVETPSSLEAGASDTPPEEPAPEPEVQTTVASRSAKKS
jgi:hypothetical protein